MMCGRDTGVCDKPIARGQTLPNMEGFKKGAVEGL